MRANGTGGTSFLLYGDLSFGWVVSCFSDFDYVQGAGFFAFGAFGWAFGGVGFDLAGELGVTVFGEHRRSVDAVLGYFYGAKWTG